MKVIIDRFEGDLAVLELENGEFINVDIRILPSNAMEGSIITISCDENETDKKRTEVKQKMNAIFRK